MIIMLQTSPWVLHLLSHTPEPRLHLHQSAGLEDTRPVPPDRSLGVESEAAVLALVGEVFHGHRDEPHVKDTRLRSVEADSGWRVEDRRMHVTDTCLRVVNVSDMLRWEQALHSPYAERNHYRHRYEEVDKGNYFVHTRQQHYPLSAHSAVDLLGDKMLHGFVSMLLGFEQRVQARVRTFPVLASVQA
jgi:hypothetical protein